MQPIYTLTISPVTNRSLFIVSVCRGHSWPSVVGDLATFSLLTPTILLATVNHMFEVVH